MLAPRRPKQFIPPLSCLPMMRAGTTSMACGGDEEGVREDATCARNLRVCAYCLEGKLGLTVRARQQQKSSF